LTISFLPDVYEKYEIAVGTVCFLNNVNVFVFASGSSDKKEYFGTVSCIATIGLKNIQLVLQNRKNGYLTIDCAVLDIIILSSSSCLGILLMDV